MTYNLYTIYDKVSKECGPVFQAKNFGVAKRYLEDMVKNNIVPPKCTDTKTCRWCNYQTICSKIGD